MKNDPFYQCKRGFVCYERLPKQRRIEAKKRTNRVAAAALYIKVCLTELLLVFHYKVIIQFIQIVFISEERIITFFKNLIKLIASQFIQ